MVDTFDSINGVKKAIEMGKWLRENGDQLVGISLDSGEFVSLSQQARKMLYEAGFEQAGIVASNDLDENLIASFKAAGAKINLWGVGTQLITGYDQPALGGVYKLTAIREPGSEWQYRLKLSEELIKISNPGLLQVRRFSDAQGEFIGDMIYNQPRPPVGAPSMVKLTVLDVEECTILPADTPYKDLLIPVLRAGEPVIKSPSLTQIRERVQTQIASSSELIKRLKMPDVYPVSLERNLSDLKQNLVKQAG